MRLIFGASFEMTSRTWLHRYYHGSTTQSTARRLNRQLCTCRPPSKNYFSNWSPVIN